MSKSSSILTALPKMKMYCMIFANSHIFRSRGSKPGSAAGSDDSISALPRFRDTIVMRLLTERGRGVRIQKRAKIGTEGM